MIAQSYIAVVPTWYEAQDAVPKMVPGPKAHPVGIGMMFKIFICKRNVSNPAWVEARNDISLSDTWAIKLSEQPYATLYLYGLPEEFGNAADMRITSSLLAVLN